LLLLATAALACAHAVPVAPATRTVNPGDRFTLFPGESAAIEETLLRVTFEGILSDNRCPVDVQCITGGQARAGLRLDLAAGRSEPFELDTERHPSAVVAGYRISLLSVSPVPRSTVQIAPGNYAVELIVARAD
jgi:hypothetical protein